MMNKHAYILISGGGTGGHIFPALAIAEALHNLDNSLQIEFVGAIGRMEMEKIPAAGYTIYGVPMAGLKREFSLQNISLPFRVVRSWWLCRKIIRKRKPIAVVGTGGYASAALGMAAATSGVPLFIQEQNAFAGITNRLLGSRARKIFVAHEGMNKFFPESKLVFSGNPVRNIFENISVSREDAKRKLGFNPDKPLLLVTGGSLGALALNQGTEKAIKIWQEQDLQVLWQTGTPYAEKAAAAVAGLPENQIKSCTFMQDMATAFIAADLVVSRAGASALAELAICGKPSILVPLPTAAENHQLHNAKSFANVGAALILDNKQTPEKLGETVLQLIQSPEKLEHMARQARTLAKPGAADSIAREILKSVNAHA